MNKRNAEHQTNMADVLHKQDNLLMIELSSRFMDVKETIRNEHQERIAMME